MTERKARLTAVRVLSMGTACALVVLLAETTAAFVSGDVFTARFFALAIPTYAGAGLVLGLVAVAIVAGLSLVGLLRPDDDTPSAASTALVIASMTLLQGGIFINDFVLAGHPVVHATSLVLDMAWGVFCGLLWLGTMRFLRMGRCLLNVVIALLGLLSTSFSTSSLYTVLPRPFEIDLGTAGTQVGIMTVVATVSFVIPIALGIAGTSIAHVRQPIVLSLALSSVLVTGFVVTSCALPITYADRGGPETSPAPGPNVILIVLDTVRADHLSCYGYDFPTTPSLEDLGDGGTVFERCYSTANWTPPGHASIFTGRFPISHGVHRVPVQATDQTNCLPLPDDEETIAEILQQSGYVTAGFAANYAWVSHHYALDQGFRYWFDAPPLRVTPVLLAIMETVAPYEVFTMITRPRSYMQAAEVNLLADRWLDERDDGPFFLFINYMDAHHPYLPPAPWNSAMIGHVNHIDHDLEGWRQSTRELSPQDWRDLRSQYDGEIAYLDSQLGEFFDALKTRGLYESSIIIVTSDHGEFLGEYGLRAHRIGLYPPVTRVPLIIKQSKGGSAVFASNEVVRTVDILPTLLDLLGIDSSARIQGTSLLEAGPGVAFAQHYNDGYVSRRFGKRFNHDQLSVFTKGLQYVVDSDGNEELYDLRANPELNLVESERPPADLLVLRHYMQAWRATIEERDVSGQVPPLVQPGRMDQLKALGYVQ